MALESRKIIYGVHSVTPYNPTTGLPLGDTAKVVGNLSINMSGDLIELNGGSQPFNWAVENGVISTETTLLLREYPNFIYEAFLGKAVTENAAETGGSVNTITNKNGTSLVDATTGVASIGVKSGSEADVKTGNYVVKAVTSTTVDVYALSDIDFKNGNELSYVDNTLKITATPLTITASTAVEIPNTGLELTGGSGTIGMTADDTAVFKSRAINTGSQSVAIGDANFSLPEIGLFCVAQKAGDNTIYTIDLFRCKGAGAPIAFAEKAFSEAEIPIRAFYDADRGAVMDIERVENI